MTVQAYIRAVRTLYLQLPSASGQFSRSDRRLAEDLCKRGVPFDALRDAIVLATARRVCRDPTRPPLSPVRSLHYFLPALDEILHHPVPRGYIEFLEHKLSQQK